MAIDVHRRCHEDSPISNRPEMLLDIFLEVLGCVGDELASVRQAPLGAGDASDAMLTKSDFPAEPTSSLVGDHAHQLNHAHHAVGEALSGCRGCEVLPFQDVHLLLGRVEDSFHVF